MAVNRHKARKLAEKYIRQGKIELAIQQFQLLLEGNPEDATTLNQIGDLYARIGKKQDAFKYYSRLADKYSKDGFNLKAIAIYKKINRIDPTQLEIYYKLGELYTEQGLKNDAKSQYTLVCDYHEQRKENIKAIEAIKRVLAIDEGNIKFRAKLAELYKKENFTDKAIHEYGMIANALSGKGMLDDAIKVLKKAHKINETNPYITANLARLKLKKGNASEADQMVQSALTAHPEDPDLIRIASEISYEAGRQDQAKGHLETLVRMNQDDTGVRQRLKELSPSAQPESPDDLPGSPEESAPPSDEMPEIDLTMEDLNHVSGEWAVADLDRPSQPAPGFFNQSQGYMPEEEAFGLVTPAIPEADREREEFISEHKTEAEVFIKYGLTDKAAEHYENILARYPDEPDLIRKLKDIYLDKGDNLAAARRCLDLARLLRSRGDAEEASALEQEANSLAPSVAEAQQAAAQGELGAGELNGSAFAFGDPAPPGPSAGAAPGGAALPQEEAAFDFGGSAQPQPPGPGRRQEAPAQEAEDEEFMFSLEDDDEPATQPASLQATGAAADKDEEEFVIELDEGEEFEADAEDEYQMKDITGHGVQQIPRELVSAPQDRPEQAGKRSLDDDVQFFDSAIKAADRSPQAAASEAEDLSLNGEQDVLSGEESEVFEEEKDFMDLASSLEKEMAELQSDDSASHDSANGLSDERSIDSIFKEFKKGVEDQLEDEDHETHYNLGIAYMEMGLIDEAIGEFQIASKDSSRLLDCCSMLGHCFREKGMPKLAVKWYQRGLEQANSDNDSTKAMLFDLGVTYEESGELDHALDTFSDVFGLDADYREVADRIAQLEEILKA